MLEELLGYLMIGLGILGFLMAYEVGAGLLRLKLRLVVAILLAAMWAALYVWEPSAAVRIIVLHVFVLIVGLIGAFFRGARKR